VTSPLRELRIAQQARNQLLDRGPATSGDVGDGAARCGEGSREQELQVEAEVQDRLRSASELSRPNRLFQAAGETMRPASWTAGWFVGNGLRGVVRASDPSPEGQVEAKLFVDEGWRRQGIGSKLLKEAMDWAGRRQASTLRLVCDRDNWPMRHFAKKFGARLDLVLGQIIVDIPLGARS
jgi:GNAT superfamily N-acetyltransferase